MKTMALRNIRRVTGASSGLKAVESNSFRLISFESCHMKERKEPCEDSSYEAVKEAARRAGNPATEWIVGTSSMGSAVYKMTRSGNLDKCPEELEAEKDQKKRSGETGGEHPTSESENTKCSGKTDSTSSDGISEGIKTISEKVKKIFDPGYSGSDERRDGVLRPEQQQRKTLREGRLDDQPHTEINLPKPAYQDCDK